jgi:hypothetical protein
MENNQQESFLQFHLDYDGGNTLKEAVRWSRFCAIVFIVLLSLFVLLILFLGSTIFAAFSQLMPSLAGLAGMGAAILIVACLIGFGIAGVLVYMLYRFSTLTRRGIEHQDQAAFSEGMKSLKNYFLISGIIAVLSLLLNFINISKLF